MSRKGKSGKGKKSTGRRKSAQKTAKPKKLSASESRRSRARRFLSFAEKILAVWGIVLTSLTSWVVFNPRVFVHPEAALDPNNPAFTPFGFHNQGYFAIHDVKYSLSFKYLKFPGDILVVGLGDYANRLSDPKQVARVIAPGEQYTVLLPLTGMEHNNIENADIAIVLTFKRVKWLSWRRKTLHRFVATQGKDRQWHWLPQPIKK